VGIADDPGHSGESGQFFGSALGVTAVTITRTAGWRREACEWRRGLGVGGGRDGAGVDDDDVGSGGRGGGGAATV